MTKYASNFTGTPEENEATVNSGFKDKVRATMGKIPFSETAIALYYCARDPETPSKVKLSLLAALAYFVVPVDLIPDAIPIAGYTDDASVIAAAAAIAKKHVKEKHREQARAALAGPEPVIA